VLDAEHLARKELSVARLELAGIDRRIGLDQVETPCRAKSPGLLMLRAGC